MSEENQHILQQTHDWAAKDRPWLDNNFVLLYLFILSVFLCCCPCFPSQRYNTPWEKAPYPIESRFSNPDMHCLTAAWYPYCHTLFTCFCKTNIMMSHSNVLKSAIMSVVLIRNHQYWPIYQCFHCRLCKHLLWPAEACRCQAALLG